jgi:hypothetical protein
MNVTGVRTRPIELIRPHGELRGIGRVESGADGGAPPRPHAGAVSMVQAQMLARAQASAMATHPGAQATAANPPRGERIDFQA